MTGKTIKHWADHLEVSPQTVYRWITSGITNPIDKTATLLAASRLGGRWRVTESAMRIFIGQTQPQESIRRAPRPTSNLSSELAAFHQAMRFPVPPANPSGFCLPPS